jgi:hypothetical protein
MFAMHWSSDCQKDNEHPQTLEMRRDSWGHSLRSVVQLAL